MPDFDIKAVRVLMGVNQGCFVVRHNEDVCINYMSVLIKQICPVIHLRVSPQTASILAGLSGHFCVYLPGQSQAPDYSSRRFD
jgi:hypothetical protein